MAGGGSSPVLFPFRGVSPLPPATQYSLTALLLYADIVFSLVGDINMMDRAGTSSSTTQPLTPTLTETWQLLNDFSQLN